MTDPTSKLIEALERWRDHNGGRCPVGSDETVEVVTRGGSTSTMRAGAVIWRYGSFIHEIMDVMPAEAEVVRYRLVRAGLTPKETPDDVSTGVERLPSEIVMRAIYAEVDRQVGIGAGMAATCPETGLFQVNADLDLITLARAIVAALAQSPTPLAHSEEDGRG